MSKCQRCPKAATLHITEVLDEDQFEELHLCEECAQKYLYETSIKKSNDSPKVPQVAEENDAEVAGTNERACEICGLRFGDFRNSGRLGCPHDYSAFTTELAPLLENIHGEVRHCGKVPRRAPALKNREQELTRLKKRLQQAIVDEAYEEAARLRDRIAELEHS